MLKTSIWPIDKTLTGSTTPVRSGARINHNEGLFDIP